MVTRSITRAVAGLRPTPSRRSRRSCSGPAAALRAAPSLWCYLLGPCPPQPIAAVPAWALRFAPGPIGRPAESDVGRDYWTRIWSDSTLRPVQSREFVQPAFGGLNNSLNYSCEQDRTPITFAVGRGPRASDPTTSTTLRSAIRSHAFLRPHAE